jgi:hypothetical protein
MRRQKKHTRKYKKKSRKTRKQRAGGICSNVNHYDVGEYVFGSTWPIYRNIRNENILIKKIGPAPWLKEDAINNEFDIAIIASKLNVGPHVYNACIKNDEGLPVGYLIMDKIIGSTFKELYGVPENIPSEIKWEYADLMDILYDNGLKYLDRHLENFMYGHTSTDPEDRVWIIDFGIVDNYNSSTRRNYRFNL